MKPFKDLSYGGQIKRLKQLARQALVNYDVGTAQLTTLAHRENTTFKITTQNNSYVIGIYRQNKHSVAEVESELIWLTSLLRDTNLIISQPIANKYGSLLTTAVTPGISQPRRCALFQWLPGRFFRNKFTDKTMKQMGKFLAKLHDYSQQFLPPEGFKRPVWDENGLLGLHTIDLPADSEEFSSRKRQVLNSAALKIRQELAQLDTDKNSFGLIHGDLHFGNCKFYKNKIQVLDFDDCVWGYYLYDLAITLYYLRRLENFDSLKTSLFIGYRDKRSLPPQYESYLEAMIAARRLHLMRDLFDRQDNPKLKAIISQFVNSTIEHMNQFLKTTN